uniref:Pyrrolo-quinoline quinone repeat domain-containing protein n=1 Tax=candidate division CPR3 bacterium TaxID=2268181 RepID=A0A7C4RAT8_UNCC3
MKRALVIFLVVVSFFITSCEFKCKERINSCGLIYLTEKKKPNRDSNKPQIFLAFERFNLDMTEKFNKFEKQKEDESKITLSDGKEIELEIPTFLGNEKRSLNGIGPVPKKLNIAWKVQLGCGHTNAKGGTWCGSGWTGQTAVVLEDGYPYLIQSGYDWHLRKIDGETGEVIWKYQFDDVIKSSPSIIINRKAKTDEEKVLIVSGSRAGYRGSSGGGPNPSLRGISYLTGREIWRFSMDRTDSYSRDCDSSALMIDGLIYIALENGYMVILDPNDLEEKFKGFKSPRVVKSQILYYPEDRAKHGGNLVTEASVARYKDSLFIASGSGHVWQLDQKTLEPIWDFYIGSDLDGTTVVSDDGFVYVAVEKQYIAGHGGVFKLNPETKSVEWFFPTGNRNFASWQGGVIGSVSLHQEKKLAAFTAIDGNLYIVHTDILDTEKVPGPDGKTYYSKPRVFWSKNVGGAIATPIFVGDHLISAGYGGVYLFSLDDDPQKIKQLDHKPGIGCESTPIVYKGKIFVGSRDGNFYCFKD